MKFDLLRGRIGKHRMHVMLIHFPSALFPFALATDIAARFSSHVSDEPGLYAQAAGLGAGVFAMAYGMADFLLLDSSTKAWKVAGIHGLLQLVWMCCFGVLFFLRLRDGHASATQLSVNAFAVIGMLVSNYLGAELIIRYQVGVDGRNGKETSPKETDAGA